MRIGGEGKVRREETTSWQKYDISRQKGRKPTLSLAVTISMGSLKRLRVPEFPKPFASERPPHGEGMFQ